MQEISTKNLSQEDLDYYNNIDITKNRDIFKTSYEDKNIYIVGTAHVSRKSQLLVKKVVEVIKPDILCIELDKQRHDAITKPNRWEGLDIFKVIKNKQTFFLVAQLMLAGFQKKIGNKLGVKPGSEMIEAINIAKEHNIPVSLVDRSVAVTLKRAWRETPFFKKMLLISNLIAGFFSKQEIDEERLSTLRKSDVITEMMEDLNKYLPEAKTVLIDERDSYIIKKTLDNPEKNIALVVGAGHVNGIKKSIESKDVNTINIEELDFIPPLPLWKKTLPWFIPLAIFAALIYGFMYHDYETVKQGALIWIIANGVFGAVGALIALAHPLSIIVSFVAAPITSLNPTIGCGFVVGLSESIFRKPRVTDFQNLSEDVASLKGWYHNRLTRILLAFIGSSIGSAVGTWVAISMIVTG